MRQPRDQFAPAVRDAAEPSSKQKEASQGKEAAALRRGLADRYPICSHSAYGLAAPMAPAWTHGGSHLIAMKEFAA